jgi:cytidine deaminase
MPQSQEDADIAFAIRIAHETRLKASTIGPTKVGAAAIADNGRVYAGCNVEHKYRSHDVHAEVNAISSMVAAGQTKLYAIVIAADREKFTPCGACMDWIFQFGSDTTRVIFAPFAGDLQEFTAGELMPHYPR